MWVKILFPFLCGVLSTVEAVRRLHYMNVNHDLITLSGFSSGGTMAQHLFVSYSSIFSGVATISHAFYRCGPGVLPPSGHNYDYYDAACTKLFNPREKQLYNPAKAVADIRHYFEQGLIDDPKYMRDKPLYIFAGLTSWLFPLQIGAGAVQVFEPFIKNRDKIKVVVQTANLTLPVDRPDFPSCAGPLNSISISNCGFSAALEALQWIIGRKYVRDPYKSNNFNRQLEPLLEFDQTEFFYGFGQNVINGNPFMDSVGFYYIPRICRQNAHRKCLLHFYFHGCGTGRNVVGSSHILNSDYLEIAETNGIIMVFPQTVRDRRGQDSGCWDTYAYTGDFYATQIGSQVIVVKNMLDRILGLEYEPYALNSIQAFVQHSFSQMETRNGSEKYKNFFKISAERRRAI